MHFYLYSRVPCSLFKPGASYTLHHQEATASSIIHHPSSTIHRPSSITLWIMGDGWWMVEIGNR